MERLIYAGLALLACVCPVSSAQTPTRSAHALLIGISDYSGSEGVSSLRGPPNDIALVRDVLKTRFAVPDENITALLEKQATHSAVERAFTELADRVEDGDFVYIHYSGHGSTCEDPRQPGGQNQTWVTFGSRKKNMSGPDSRDVVDKEINLWLQPLYEKARAAAREGREPMDIVFVSDSCHSGTVARAVEKGRFTAVREIPPAAAPCPPMPSAAENSSSLPGVRIGAAQDTESAIEKDPRGRECDVPKNCYGVFTWNWVKALRQAKPGEKWGDVYKRAFAFIAEERFSVQRPQIEGHKEMPVFGGQFPAAAPSVAIQEIRPKKRTAVLAAGSASGVTQGSVYRLFDPAAPARTDLPELEVTKVATPFSSEAKVRSGQVKVGDLVMEVSHAYQFRPIRLLVSGDFAGDRDKEIIAAIQSAVKGLEGFELVPSRAQADLVLHVLRPRMEEAGVAHPQSPTQRLPQSRRDEPPQLWVVTPYDELLHDNLRFPLTDMQTADKLLKDNLRKLAWAQQVRQLHAVDAMPPISVQVSLLRPDPACTYECAYAPPDKEEKKNPHRKLGVHSLSETGPALRKNDSITFVLRNDDDRPWYAYLLDIAPDGKVQRVYPTGTSNEESGELSPGHARDLAATVWLLLCEPGVETVKLIVSSMPIDVQLLENKEGYRRRSELNPLEQLLHAAARRRNGAMATGEWATQQADYEVPRK